MRGRDDVRAVVVHARVDRERGAVHLGFAVHDVALRVDQDQIRSADVSEVEPERIDPEALGLFGVARGDVARDAFIEAVAREQAERRGELLFAVEPLGGDGLGLLLEAGGFEELWRGHAYEVA